MRTLRIGLLGLFALVAAPHMLHAQAEKPRVAVFELNAFAIGRPEIRQLATTFTDMLTTELAKSQSFTVLSRDELNDLLAKHNFKLSGRVSDDEAMRMGKIIGASHLVLGGAFFERGMARMDIRMVEVETSATKAALKETYKEDQLLTLVEKIGAVLAQDVKLPAVARADAQPQPVAAVLAYSRGLDFEKRGKKPQAAQMFEKTLKLSPTYEDAQKALARVK